MRKKMTSKEFSRALDMMGLYGTTTKEKARVGAAFGLSLRQIQRFYLGEQVPTPLLRKLVRLCVNYGIPPSEVAKL